MQQAELQDTVTGRPSIGQPHDISPKEGINET